MDSFTREVRWMAASAHDRGYIDANPPESRGRIEPVPPFGLVRLANGASTFARGGQCVHFVDRPDGLSAREQNPYLLACNGPQPMDRYGLITQDWPAQVLFDIEHPIAPGRPCGPAEDSYICSPEGHAFMCIGWDNSWGFNRGPGLVPGAMDPIDGKYRIAWIVPNVYAIIAGYAHVTGGGDVGAGERVPFAYESCEEFTVVSTDRGGYGHVKEAVTASLGGLYEFGYQATLSSEDAPSGAKLELALEVNGSIAYPAYRLNDIEIDNYGDPILYTAENVARTGLISLEAEDEIAVVNNSAYEMNVDMFGFWLRRFRAA